MTDITPEAMARRQARQWGDAFWLLPIGLVAGIATLFEGSFVWALFGVASAWLGITSGLAGGERVLESVKTKPMPLSAMWSVQALVLFWVPQILYMVFGIFLAWALPMELAPWSRDAFFPFVMLESSTLYFCTTGAAWYKTWRWVRAPQ